MVDEFHLSIKNSHRKIKDVRDLFRNLSEFELEVLENEKRKAEEAKLLKQISLNIIANGSIPEIQKTSYLSSLNKSNKPVDGDYLRQSSLQNYNPDKMANFDIYKVDNKSKEYLNKSISIDDYNQRNKIKVINLITSNNDDADEKDNSQKKKTRFNSRIINYYDNNDNNNNNNQKNDFNQYDHNKNKKVLSSTYNLSKNYNHVINEDVENNSKRSFKNNFILNPINKIQERAKFYSSNLNISSNHTVDNNNNNSKRDIFSYKHHQIHQQNNRPSSRLPYSNQMNFLPDQIDTLKPKKTNKLTNFFNLNKFYHF